MRVEGKGLGDLGGRNGVWEGCEGEEFFVGEEVV
jgi:hypothetical protein